MVVGSSSSFFSKALEKLDNIEVISKKTLFSSERQLILLALNDVALLSMQSAYILPEAYGKDFCKQHQKIPLQKSMEQRFKQKHLLKRKKKMY